MAIVYFEDRFVDEADARIPITTHALHYGTAVFEGIRSYGDGAAAALFRPRDHYDRLLRNAAWLEMKPKWDSDALIELTREVLRRNGFFDDRYIRPLIYKTSQTIGAGLPEGEALAIITVPMPRGPMLRPAVRATWSTWRRFPAAACPAGAKISGLYVNSSLAKAEGLSRGYDQPILLNMSGDVAEGYGANLFVAHGSRLTTPPVDADILGGITRDSLLRFFGEQTDASASAASLSQDDVLRADEIFLCGTGLEIVPIRELEGRAVGDGTGHGPMLRRAADWYRQIVSGLREAPPGWLVPV
ncbi:MAG: aminotransferase class IV [Acidobacteriota bacterium]